jgi:hypothetical protein
MLRAGIAPATFAGLTLVLFHAVLFQLGNRIPSAPGGDLFMQFLPWRDFGFSQLRHGNFALWNPYVYGGTPYFAGFQAALLYPPNWLHLLLPLTTAINWIIAIHFFAAGYFTYLWCRGRYASIGASILAGIMFMFSGPYFLHVYAGHLPHLCIMVWVPLLFLSLDKLNETGSLKWCLLGSLAVGMQMFAGHPQYLYYTGLASLLYIAITSIRSRHRFALGGGYIIIYVAATLLGAVQLLSGVQAAGESVRAGGTNFGFASMFALPPENLLTFLAPGFLGKLPLSSNDANAITYFGRCYLWEMSVFVSISGLVLFFFGAVVRWRKCLCLLVMIGVTLALALGRHLPLYRPLYDFLPEYNHLRGVSKFTFPMCLFICVIAGHGFDTILAQRRTLSVGAIITGIAAIVLAITALALAPSASGSPHGIWTALIGLIGYSGESYLPSQTFRNATFIRDTSKIAAHAIGWAAATLGAITLLLAGARQKPLLAYGLIVLATVELFIFARQNLSINPADSNYPTAWLDRIRATPGDYRVVHCTRPDGDEDQFVDEGMSLGIQSVWGYDPGVMKRYAETLYSAQGINPDVANQYLHISKGSLGLFQMLRCRFALQWQGDVPTVAEIFSPLPVAQLVSNWVVLPVRDDALHMIDSNDFDPRKTVILESSPGVDPSEDGVRGPAEVVASSTDWVEIRTTIPTPAMLLITNNYSTGWRVIPLETTSQTDYRIIPANYTLMAIPLQAGSHHLRIEYRPAAFVIGKWISIAALIGYAACLLGVAIQKSHLPLRLSFRRSRLSGPTTVR